MIEEKNYSVLDIDIMTLCPITIDGVKLLKREHNIEAVLPPNMIGEQYARWNRSIGGIFFRDLKRKQLGKTSGKYIKLEAGKENFIARILEGDEADTVYVKEKSGFIGDKKYLKIKDIIEDEVSNVQIEYIEDMKAENINLHAQGSSVPLNIPPEDEESSSNRSISLFD